MSGWVARCVAVCSLHVCPYVCSNSTCSTCVDVARCVAVCSLHRRTCVLLHHAVEHVRGSVDHFLRDVTHQGHHLYAALDKVRRRRAPEARNGRTLWCALRLKNQTINKMGLKHFFFWIRDVVLPSNFRAWAQNTSQNTMLGAIFNKRGQGGGCCNVWSTGHEVVEVQGLDVAVLLRLNDHVPV